MTTIAVNWTGPLSYEQAVAQGTGANDYGLYQIYGQNDVYSNPKGRRVLLYIGKAVHQTFKTRLKQHSKSWLTGDERIHLGRLDSESFVEGKGRDRWEDWTNKVEDAEKLSIWRHCPSYNSHHIARFPNLNTVGEIMIVNVGEDLGSLRPEYKRSELDERANPEAVDG